MKLQALVAVAVFLAPAGTSCRSTDIEAVDRLRSADLSHDVFFTLKPGAAENAGRLANACMGLAQVPGVTHVTAGLRDETQVRDVNEQSFHVALHVEFEDHAAYEAYGPHPVHQELLSNFGEMFESVVVYDATINRLFTPPR